MPHAELQDIELILEATTSGLYRLNLGGDEPPESFPLIWEEGE